MPTNCDCLARKINILVRINGDDKFPKQKVSRSKRRGKTMNKTGAAESEYTDGDTNVDELPLSRAARLAWVTVAPVILLLGTFGNAMSIIVYYRMSAKSKSAVSVYLIALAVSDLTSLHSGLTVHWLNNLLNYDVLAVSNFVCKTLMWFIYTSGALCAWLLVAVTLQRAVSVVWPHRVNSLITFRSSLAVVLSLTCTLMLTHVHILYGLAVVVDRIAKDAATLECYLVNEEYADFFYRIWSWVDLLVFSLVPFAILLASNTVLLKTVVSSAREARHRLSVGDKQQVTSREKMASSMTVTLIVLSFTFITLTGPICAYLLMKPYVFNDNNVNYKKESVRRLIFAISNLVWYANSAINFYLYCLSGSRFRSELSGLLNELIQALRYTATVNGISIKGGRAR